MSGMRHLMVGVPTGGISCESIGVVYPVHGAKTMLAGKVGRQSPFPRPIFSGDVDPRKSSS